MVKKNLRIYFMSMGKTIFSSKISKEHYKNKFWYVLIEAEYVPPFSREGRGSLGLALSQLYISLLGLSGGGIGTLRTIFQIILFFFTLSLIFKIRFLFIALAVIWHTFKYSVLKKIYIVENQLTLIQSNLNLAKSSI